ncbi:glycerol uptake facilitator-like aquaporin [Nocardia mexicana]|uniref:Glycerol uptake facilitator-like aquaporin n=2 Tax=Nocardia mexicana TaxID=279262 RepID=A0A370GRL8_9NOCA|nr:glycerol uptake facilitator-like aquaporin [Nocardia mexicana]
MPAVGKTGVAQRMLAELVGTAMLVTAIVGSGIAAQRLSQDPGARLFANSAATALGLSVLIMVFGPVSGAHLNPVVSVVDWVRGRRADTGLSAVELVGYLNAQIVGGVAGAVVANVMFGMPAVQQASEIRSAAGLFVGEMVATAGLILVVSAPLCSRRFGTAAVVVGAYIGAAQWFTSSTSFANPAVTIARSLSDTYTGIAAGSVPGFILAQFVGAAIGLGLVTVFERGG